MTLAALCMLQLSLASPAVAVSVTGSVQADSGGQRVRLARFDAITAGATIITGDKSAAQIRLASGSLLRLGPKSKLALTTLEHESPAGRRKESVKLVVGRLWARVTNLFGGGSRFDVETTSAVAGVRGTSFIVDAQADSSRFVLLSGAVNLLREGATFNLDKPGAFVDTSADGFGISGSLDAGALDDLLRSIGGAGATMVSALAAANAGATPAAGGGRGATRLDIIGPGGFVDSGTGPGPADLSAPGGTAILNVDVTVNR